MTEPYSKTILNFTTRDHKESGSKQLDYLLSFCLTLDILLFNEDKTYWISQTTHICVGVDTQEGGHVLGGGFRFRRKVEAGPSTATSAEHGLETLG